MLSICLTGTRQLENRTVDEPQAGAGEVKFKPLQIGICGSDVLAYHGMHKYVSFPIVLGHECVGRVEEIGAGVEGLEAGDLITVQPQLVCSSCYACRHGSPNVCENKRFMGISMDGFYCEHYVAPADNVIKLPNDFDVNKGMLIEPFAVACNANDRGGVGAGTRVVVMGSGTIGNCCAQVAKALGADVLITDISDDKLAMARECGVEKTFNTSKTSLSQAMQQAFGDYADVIIDCCAVPSVIVNAIESAGNASRIVLVGTFERNVELDLTILQRGEIDIVSVMQYKRKHYLQAIELLGSNSVSSDSMIQARYKLGDAAQAFRFIDDNAGRVLKVALYNE